MQVLQSLTGLLMQMQQCARRPVRALPRLLFLGAAVAALGLYPSFAKAAGGHVIGWGANNSGQSECPGAIAGGYNHSLALTEAGEVIAWGSNSLGQSTVPVEAQSGIIAIAAGGFHSMALTDAGEIIAWGDNSIGQCTVPVAAQSGIIAIAGGMFHSLALTQAGEVIAWGANGCGQSTVPVEAQSAIIYIAGGEYHSLALTEAGEVIAWGGNDYGQCSVPVAAQSGIIAIAAGTGYSMALTDAGQIIAWGDNSVGQCTVPVEAQSGIISIAAGAHHSMALTAGDEVIAWGYNAYGQRTVPVEAQSGIIYIAAGDNHSMALTSAGEVLAWGYDAYDQCDVPLEAQSGVISRTISIAAGSSHSMALTEAGGVIAWGHKGYGQCDVPEEAQSGIIDMAAGSAHSMALTEAGEVIAWGNNGYGQCTVPVEAQSGIIAIAAGLYHGLALAESGEVIAWGDNTDGQCTVPAEAQSGIITIAGGNYHSLALTEAGEVIAWGWNVYGQCDVPPAAQSGIIAIAGGSGHSLALTEAGEVIAWGYNAYGQCTVPVEAQSGIIAVAGRAHSLALTEAGEVIAWGANGSLQCNVPPAAQSGAIAIAAGSGYSLALRCLRPTGDFSGSPTSGEAPLAVSFTDLSTGEPTSWAWDFGDGATSNEQNPSHVYRFIGSYTVALTASRAGLSHTVEGTDYIAVTATANSAHFAAGPTTGLAPLTVDFTDLSTGDIDYWHWDFGDGGTSDEPSPTHSYADPGSYTVTLTVTGPLGWASETKEDHIVVLSEVTADFSASPLSGEAPLAVSFTDLSTGDPTSWEWDFGDGGTSTQQNPSHTYTDVGSYTVSLTAVNAGGEDSEVKTDYVTVRFTDVAEDHWACQEILACVEAGIVAGYEDGCYHGDWPVDRAQMAAYISRALAGGEENVPGFTGTPTFPDVPEDFWALKYVEYAVDQSVVGGYEDGSYHPEYEVTRDQMAVYVARALVAPSGEAAFADYVPSDPRNFPDVPSESWAYKHVEYCVEHGVVQGYDDGFYRPETVVTRDQMAVYVARAFGLIAP